MKILDIFRINKLHKEIKKLLKENKILRQDIANEKGIKELEEYFIKKYNKENPINQVNIALLRHNIQIIFEKGYDVSDIIIKIPSNEIDKLKNIYLDANRPLYLENFDEIKFDGITLVEDNNISRFYVTIKENKP